MLITLEAARASATISPLGAEWRSWRAGGNDLLWSGDPAWWGKCSPVLFPVVGWTRNGEMRIKRRIYPLALHGFAATQTWDVVAQGVDHACLRLCDGAATRALYPFAFELTVDYRLTDTFLEAAFTVANPGDEPMPYALGLHPGFAWPFAGGDPARHRIVFAGDVSREVPVIAPGGLISRRKRSVPIEGRTLPLTPDLFRSDALCFLDPPSTTLAYENGNGQAIEIETRDFPHFALWTKPGAPFVSIEAWTGYGDPEGFDGDIFDKPSMRVLPPGARASHDVRYGWRG